MVGYNMDGPARDHVLKLMEEKDKIEGELREQNAILHTNNVGMDDALVDAEGYPRNDIDVYKVRHARHRIICLKNDLKEIMSKIEQGLWEVYDSNSSHGAGPSRAPADSAELSNGDSHIENGHSNCTNDRGNYMNGHGNLANGHINYANGANQMQNDVNQCFATIGFVQPGSPADIAGLVEDDQLIQFGSINHSNFYDITQVQDVVSHSVCQNIHVRVKRGHHIISSTVVPRPWAQPGLLGCQIRRLS